MKIYFITSKLNIRSGGGSTTEVDLMVRGWQRLGHEVTVVTAFSDFNDITESLPYQCLNERINRRDQIGIQRGIYKILKKYSCEADIFHVDGHIFLYGAGLYRRLGGSVPVVACFNREQAAWPENVSALFRVQAKESLFKKIKKKLRWYAERYIGMPLANGMDYMWFTNPFLEKAYADFGMRTEDKHIIIGDPFDFNEILRKNNIAEDYYLSHNKKTGFVTLFYSSRMVPGKGFDVLLNAFSKLKNKDNFRLILGGTGPDESLIRQMIKELGLEKYIEMPGWVSKEELHVNLMKSDIFVQARWRSDMSSMSLTEAMTFGLPSIVPAGGGTEWVGGKSSLCFKMDDVDDLTAKIERLGNDYELRSELSKQCYIRLREPDVNYEKTIPAMATIMEQLVNQLNFGN